MCFSNQNLHFLIIAINVTFVQQPSVTVRNQRITISGCKYQPSFFDNKTILHSFEYYEYRNETSRLKISPPPKAADAFNEGGNLSSKGNINELTMTEENSGFERLGEYRCLVYDPDTMRSPVYSISVRTDKFRK